MCSNIHVRVAVLILEFLVTSYLDFRCVTYSAVCGILLSFSFLHRLCVQDLVLSVPFMGVDGNYNRELLGRGLRVLEACP